MSSGQQRLRIALAPSLTFTARPGLPRSNGTLEITNNGLLVKSQGTGTSSLSYPFGRFDNEGTVRVETGTLLLQNGASAFTASGDGAFEVAKNAVLQFDQATYPFGDGSTVSGEGTLLVTSRTVFLGRAEMTGLTRVTGGSLRFMNTDTASELAAVEVTGGELGGDAEVSVNGLLTWTGGRLGRASTTAVLNLLGGVDVKGPAGKTFGGPKYVNSGMFRWQEGTLGTLGASEFLNLEGATFSIESDEDWVRLDGFIRFVNEGTIVKTGTEGRTGVNLSFAPFNNDGEFRVESGTLSLRINGKGLGSRSIDTGLYRIQDGATLRFSGYERFFTPDAVIEGLGTVGLDGDIVNQGQWRPGAPLGTLTINSDWPQPDVEAVLEIEMSGLEAGTEFDQLVVTGAATLGGTLRITLRDGYRPVVGDRFQVISAAGGATGAFDELDLPEGVTATVETSATGADLVITAIVSEEEAPGVPIELALHAPAPNPTRGISSLQIDLPASDRVRVSVYDALGREGVVALDGERPAGRHTVALATDGLATGVYVVRLVAGGEVRTQRLTVVR